MRMRHEKTIIIEKKRKIQDHKKTKKTFNLQEKKALLLLESEETSIQVLARGTVFKHISTLFE